MTEKDKIADTSGRNEFPPGVAGRSLRDRVRSSVTREELGVEPLLLLLRIERSQLRWLGHLFRMPPGRLPREVFQACPIGGGGLGEDQGHAGETMSLGWPGNASGSPLEELEEVSGVDEPTEWCAPMVVVPKGTGRGVRICSDLTELNKSVLRERHPLPSVENTLGQLAGAKVFSKLDANAGFWQIPLSKESSLLTTFITPFGRYCYNRLCFGISSAPEHFQKRMQQILDGLDGVLCQMDDVLIWGATQIEHDQRLRRALSRLQEAGVTLNDKCEVLEEQD
ncbi:hypothetical protein L3Q82_003310 [Scortum barcoo]|uniref:Uncharacterized protein n=1 Tax=Scortum barcoo TaxID=214431 RepID=A0ACB8VM24_9TELE|nr:hypothetical protein L3Q82_003310 [Scortum barcoo]